MKEELQNALSTLIDKAVSAAEMGAEFLSDQIPEVINQLLIWKAAESFLTTLFVIITLFIMFKFNIKQYKWWIQKPEGDYLRRIDGDLAPFALVNVVQILIILLLVPLINLTWLQILVAPKIFLIEYAVKFIK